jgi:hypothetical protein
MCVHDRRYPREVSVGNLVPCRPQLIDNLRNPECIPDENRVRQQAEAACLIHDLLGISTPKLTSVHEEQTPTDQLVAGFAPVQLQLHMGAEVGIRQVAQYEDRLHDTAERRESSRQSVRRRTIGEPLDDHIRWGGAILKRGYAYQEIPLLPEQVRFRHALKQRIKTSVVGATVHLIKVLVGQVVNRGMNE